MRTSIVEVLLGELLESSVVELVLEVLKSESELEDGGIDVVASNKRSGRGKRCHQRQSAEDGWLHHDERVLKMFWRKSMSECSEVRVCDDGREVCCWTGAEQLFIPLAPLCK